MPLFGRHGTVGVQTIALVCDAGTPTVADPGVGLIRAALAAGHRVCPLPGAVAAIVALCGSGLSPQRFAFDGFPPRTPEEREAFFSYLAAETRTLILYESGAYLRATLSELSDHLGPQRRVVLAYNLTTDREYWWRGTLNEARALVKLRRLHGYCTVIISGKV
jgi:16S rRNA (cytidine1402-2'-O)-methyltransferase